MSNSIEPTVTISLYDYNEMKRELLALKSEMKGTTLVRINDLGMVYYWQVKTNDEVIEKLTEQILKRDNEIKELKKPKKSIFNFLFK